MITAIAIDDEPLALEIVKNFCRKVDFIDLKETFTETQRALDYLNREKVGLLFLDINMPALSGIDLYKKVDKDTMVIFTTAYSEYAVEGFNMDAIDYLLKPYSFERFKKAVDKAKEFQEYSNKKESVATQYLFVRVDYSIVKIVLTEILYIEGLDNYLKIHFDNGKSLLVRMSMKSVSEKLPAEQFIRVHRSFIIPVSKVQFIRNKTIYLAAGNDKKPPEIPIGTNYTDTVMQLLKEQ